MAQNLEQWWLLELVQMMQNGKFDFHFKNSKMCISFTLWPDSDQSFFCGKIWKITNLSIPLWIWLILSWGYRKTWNTQEWSNGLVLESKIIILFVFALSKYYFLNIHHMVPQYIVKTEILVSKVTIAQGYRKCWCRMKLCFVLNIDT